LFETPIAAEGAKNKRLESDMRHSVGRIPRIFTYEHLLSSCAIVLHLDERFVRLRWPWLNLDICMG
jgi:hypothetical protein